MDIVATDTVLTNAVATDTVPIFYQLILYWYCNRNVPTDTVATDTVLQKYSSKVPPLQTFYWSTLLSSLLKTSAPSSQLWLMTRWDSFFKSHLWCNACCPLHSSFLLVTVICSDEEVARTCQVCSKCEGARWRKLWWQEGLLCGADHCSDHWPPGRHHEWGTSEYDITQDVTPERDTPEHVTPECIAPKHDTTEDDQQLQYSDLSSYLHTFLSVQKHNWTSRHWRRRLQQV